MEDNTHGARVRLSILEMGLRLWAVDPTYVSARRIANELDMTHSNVLYHFKHTQGLKDAIAFHAVKQGESRVIVHLIASGHKAIAAMDEPARQEHLRLMGGC